MQKMSMWGVMGVLSVAVGTVSASDEEMASLCQRLEAALEQQVLVLREINDSASAVAAMPQLQAALDAQKALFGVNESELWNYIDRTEPTKVGLMRVLQRLAAEVDRLKKAEFYGHAPLQELLL